mmetsp:Transcript_23649/g.40681  ORF Transcript_23649/g.40681 Transcript_23649/m.40681 type:complete len:309 (-) Transcript_23649:821-1747(-)
MLEQKGLVERRRDFGDEDGVVRVLVGLVEAREVRVHAVARLVGEGEHVRHQPVEVHQDVRLAVVAAGAVGAGALVLVLVPVHPPLLVQPAPQRLLVLAAERSDAVGDELHGLVERVILGQFCGHAVHIHVVQVQVVRLRALDLAQQLLSQAHVLVEGRDAVLDGGDEGAVDRGVDVVRRQGGLEAAAVLARLRLEQVRLNCAVEELADCVFVGEEAVVHLLQGVLAEHAVGRAQVHAVQPVRQLPLRALPVNHLLELDVGVVEGTEGLRRSAQRLARRRQEGLQVGAEGVLLLLDQPLEVEPVVRHRL